MNPYDEAIEGYASKSSRAVDQVFRDLKEETYAKMSNPGMQVGEVEGRFLRLLVAMTGPAGCWSSGHSPDIRR